MIAHLQGRVLFSDGQETIILTVGGIGHQVRTHLVLPEGQNINLYIAHIIREASQELYGFSNLREKKLFEMLLTVNGVGPRGAYSLVSVLGTNVVLNAITLDDKKTLAQAPGIGTKTAAQIILDLRPKIHRIKMYTESYSGPTFDNLMPGDNLELLSSTLPLTTPRPPHEAQLINEALMACKELGFKEQQIAPLLQKIVLQHQITRPEQLVHLVLKEI